jgi:hypothetical protein
MIYNIEQLIQLKRKADERFVLDEIEEIEVDEMEEIDETLKTSFELFAKSEIYLANYSIINFLLL